MAATVRITTLRETGCSRFDTVAAGSYANLFRFVTVNLIVGCGLVFRNLFVIIVVNSMRFSLRVSPSRKTDFCCDHHQIFQDQKGLHMVVLKLFSVPLPPHQQSPTVLARVLRTSHHRQLPAPLVCQSGSTLHPRYQSPRSSRCLRRSEFSYHQLCNVAGWKSLDRW